MSEAQDRIFFRNFSLIVVAIAGILLLFLVVAHAVVGNDNASMAIKADRVAQVTKPVGQVRVMGEDSPNETTDTMVADQQLTEINGKTVYQGVCAGCHGVSALASMIPQTGDTVAWEARIAQGINTLYEHAIHGYTGNLGMMPAKGGRPDLSDDEVKAAVDYIVGEVK